MTTPTITLNGLASNLDTAGIINKLVAVQGNQQTLLKNQQATRNNAVTAYSALLSNISTTAGQLKSLADIDSWSTTTASSSSTAVTAVATGGATGSLSFDVTAVAKAHTLISDGSVSSTSAVVAPSGTITLKRTGSADLEISAGSGTLSEVVAAINNEQVGVSATAVQTSPGNYRLQVIAAGTGAASEFSLEGISGFTGGSGGPTDGMMKDLVNGTDAAISVSGLAITSATNTFSDVIQGISFTVNKVEAGVTVAGVVDTTAVTDQISAVVTNLNNLLASIKTETAWDPDTRTGGPLLGDSTVRSLQQELLSTVTSLNAPGISITSDGQVQFDQAAFNTAFTDDPATTMAAWGAGTTFTSAGSDIATMRFVSTGTIPQAGTYDIEITATAQTEQWQAIPPGTGVVGRTIALMRTSSGNRVDYTIADGVDLSVPANLDAEIASLNAILAQRNMGVVASRNSTDDGFLFTATSPGSAGAFDVEYTDDSGGTATLLDVEVVGSDIEGSIDGVTATGIGNLLTLPASADSPAAGLAVQVTSVADTLSGTLEYAPGLAQRLSELFDRISDSESGSLVQAQTAAKNQAKDLQTQIDAWTDRLEAYRATITARFNAMETALQNLKTQQTALSSFFNLAEAKSES